MTSAKNVRGKYTSSGYRHGEGKTDAKLYIAKVPAGSRQDELLDHNRMGYRVERPWRQTPTPLFEAEAAPQAAPVQSEPVTRRRKKKQGMIDFLAQEAGRAKRDVAACIVIGALILLIVAAWGQKMVLAVNIQNSIAAYQTKTVAIEKENEKLEQQLELAKNGERIRNLAQNELGMLRPERAQTQTIYIQTANDELTEQVQKQEKPKFELLDILLGLLDVFHIGE